MSDQPEKLSNVTFANVQSKFFRVIHADGVVFSVNTQQFVNLMFFSERATIPEHQSFALNPNDALGEEKPRVMSSHWTRETEVNVVFNRELAKRLHKILGDYLGAHSESDVSST